MESVYPVIIFSEELLFPKENLVLVKVKKRAHILPFIGKIALCYELTYHNKKLYIDLSDGIIYDDKETGLEQNSLYGISLGSFCQESGFLSRKEIEMRMNEIDKKRKTNWKRPLEIANSTIVIEYLSEDFHEKTVSDEGILNVFASYLDYTYDAVNKDFIFQDQLMLVKMKTGRYHFIDSRFEDFIDFITKEKVNEEDFLEIMNASKWGKEEPYPIIDYSKAYQILKKENNELEKTKAVIKCKKY